MSFLWASTGLVKIDGILLMVIIINPYQRAETLISKTHSHGS